MNAKTLAQQNYDTDTDTDTHTQTKDYDKGWITPDRKNIYIAHIPFLGILWNKNKNKNKKSYTPKKTHNNNT